MTRAFLALALALLLAGCGQGRDLLPQVREPLTREQMAAAVADCAKHGLVARGTHYIYVDGAAMPTRYVCDLPQAVTVYQR